MQRQLTMNKFASRGYRLHGGIEKRLWVGKYTLRKLPPRDSSGVRALKIPHGDINKRKRQLCRENIPIHATRVIFKLLF